MCQSPRIRPSIGILAAALVVGPAARGDTQRSRVTELPYVAGEPGLTVVISDPDGQLDAPPVATVSRGTTTAELRLADDGQGPDSVGGDGIWTGRLVGPPTGDDVEIALLTAQGTTLWRDGVPMTQVTATVRALLLEGEPVVVVDLPPPTTGSASSAAPPPPPTSAPQDLGAIGPIVFAAVLALLGFGLGAWMTLAFGPIRMSHRIPGLRSPGVAAPTSGPRCTIQAWCVPTGLSPGGVLGSLARHFASAGPVLLLGSPSDRAALGRDLAAISQIRCLSAPTPSPADVVEAARALQVAGDPVVLIDPHGVSIGAGSARGALLSSLLEALPAGVGAIVVLAAGDDLMDATPLPGEPGGLRLPDGVLLPV